MSQGRWHVTQHGRCSMRTMENTRVPRMRSCLLLSSTGQVPAADLVWRVNRQLLATVRGMGDSGRGDSKPGGEKNTEQSFYVNSTTYQRNNV